MRSVLLGLLGWGAAWACLTSGCTHDRATARPEHIAREGSPIQGGETDEADTSVVAIANTTIDELCTGARIGPNLVLTAAHCVSKTTTSGAGCDAFVFGGAVDPANLFFSDAPLAPSTLDGYAAVAEIRAVPSAGESLCDRDLALVILASTEGVAASPALVPRVDAPLEVGETFAAVGYGQSGLGAGIGTRRRLDGLTATCVGDCNKSYTGVLEWIGHAALAHTGGRPGDSGSPAIDAEGEVVGVFLRHLEYPGTSDKPDELVYASLDAHAVFLREGALRAAELGGYDAPSWAVAEGDDGAPDAEGCAFAGTGETSAPGALAVCVGIALHRRRSSKRTPKAPARSGRRAPDC